MGIETVVPLPIDKVIRSFATDIQDEMKANEALRWLKKIGDLTKTMNHWQLIIDQIDAKVESGQDPSAKELYADLCSLQDNKCAVKCKILRARRGSDEQPGWRS